MKYVNVIWQCCKFCQWNHLPLRSPANTGCVQWGPGLMTSFAMDFFIMPPCIFCRHRYTCVLNVIDCQSFFSMAQACPDQTTHSICQALDSLWSSGIQPPAFLRCDNAAAMASPTFQAYCRSKQIEVLYCLPNVSTGDSLVENSNRWVRKAIQKTQATLQSASWAECMGQSLLVHNSCQRKYCQNSKDEFVTSPSKLVFGFDRLSLSAPGSRELGNVQLLIQIREHMQKLLNSFYEHLRIKQAANDALQLPQIQVNDIVLLMQSTSGKLDRTRFHKI